MVVQQPTCKASVVVQTDAVRAAHLRCNIALATVGRWYLAKLVELFRAAPRSQLPWNLKGRVATNREILEDMTQTLGKMCGDFRDSSVILVG